MNFSDIIICSDFDGTLTGNPKDVRNAVVTPLGTICAETAAAVKRFASGGGRFVVVSGRSPKSMDFLYDYLPVDDLFAGINGAAVQKHCTGELIHVHPMRISPSEFAARTSKFSNLFKDVNLTDVGAGLHNWKTADGELGTFLRKFDKALKITAYEPDHDKMGIIYENLRAALSDVCEVEMSCPHIVECFDKGAGKNQTVEFLRRSEPNKTIVAAGDYSNDVGMLISADMAFCPENASENVKSVCRAVFRDSGDGFIADVIDYLEKL